MTRNGKIARLPRHIREQLNRRLEDGEPGEPLLEWLNGLPEVVDVLKRQFGGLPINKQSLSQWRLGGYEDWLRHAEACEALRQLTEQAGDLDAEADEQSVSEMLAKLMSTELLRAMKSLLAEELDPKERWRRLQELLSQLSQLRRADHRAARLQMDEERWEKQRGRLEKEEWTRKLQKAKDRALAPFWDRLKRGPLAQIFGGGEFGEKIADRILEVQNMDLPEWDGPPWRDQAASDPVRPSQGES